VLIALATAPAFAVPIPSLDLVKLFDSADVVAMGRIVDIYDAAVTTIDTVNGSHLARQISGTMAVDQYLKGTANAEELHFTFALPDEPIGYGSVTPGTYRMLFLRRAGESFEVASVFYPALVAQPTSIGVSKSGLEGVVAVLRTVILQDDASTDDRVSAVNALASTNAQSSQASLEAGLAVSNVAVRLRSAAALLMLGNLRGLSLVEAALLSPNRPSDEIAVTLRGAIALGTRDAAAVPVLGRLVGAADVETRRAASFALSRVSSPDAAAALITRFNDSDFEVRYNAVRGVSRALGEVSLTPSEEDFRLDESFHVNLLRQGFAERGLK